MLGVQFILAMEKRLLTDRFALRYATTIHGIMFTDAFFAYKYFNSEIADFREEMNRLAYSLMHNPDLPQPQPTSTGKASKRARRTSPNSGGVASSSSDGGAHPLVKMRVLPNYMGGKDGRQRCCVCDRKTVWACLDCSEAPHSLFPLCPMVCNQRGTISVHNCYEKHCADPLWMPKGRAPTGGAKRRRATADDDGVELSYDCDDDDCEDEEL